MISEFKIFGITFYPYSLFMIAGAVVCFLLFMLLTFKRHKNLSGENAFALQMLVVSLGMAVPSAMLVDSLFKYFETGTFKLGGATFYGGLLFSIALFPALLALKKKRKVSVYERLCDLAPCIPAGHCLGRIGCFFGGCCFGSPTDSVLGVVFPEGSLPYDFYGGAVKIHPTQLYEAAFLAVLFVFLLFAGKNKSLPLYFILYGVGRLFIEFFRNDDRGTLYGLPMSPAQFISAVLIVAGAVILALKKDKKPAISEELR